MSLKYISTPTKILADSITSAAMSFRLNNITGWDGEPLTSGDFGTQAYGVFRNAAKTQIELFEYDPATIANPEITILRRGLQFDGNLTTEVAGNKKVWNKGDTQVDLGTDLPQMFQFLQEYIDGIAIAGAPNASTSLKGIGQVSTAPVDPDTPIFVGDNDPRILTEDQKAAAEGGGDFGTPSTSNKFVTEEFLSLQLDGNVQEFTASGTWTKPSSGRKALIEMVQAGGGGGCAPDLTYRVAGGGAGGSYVSFEVPLDVLDATHSITIGAGGVGATSTTGAVAGSVGGNTIIANLVTINGAAAGGATTANSFPQSANGGAPAITVTPASGITLQNLITYLGGTGGGSTVGSSPVCGVGGSVRNGAGGGGSASSLSCSAAGGTSTRFGAGSNGSQSGTPTDATGIGGGGGGRANPGKAGNGAPGFVRITVY
jgi:hypothetical protein